MRTGRLAIGLGLAVLVGCTPGTTAIFVGDDGGGTSGGAPSATSSVSNPITASTIDPSDSLSAGSGSQTSAVDETADDATSDTSSADTEGTDSGTTGVSTTGTATTLTDTSTTGMGEDSSSDMGGESTDGDTTDGGTTSGGSSSSSTSGGGNSSTGAGESSSGAGCDGIGNYDPCLDLMGVPNSLLCGFPGATCINGGAPPIASVCSQTVCVDDCDCPAAPAGGNAAVTCGDIVGTPNPECYIDCSGGETCPDTMDCYADVLCVHAITVDPWGSCVDSGTCGVSETCIVDDPMMVGNGVCAEQGCANVGDCPAAPLTGTAPVTCGQVVAGPPNECYLDCAAAQSCPNGMDCVFNFLCMWPQP